MKKITIRNTTTANDLVRMGILHPINSRPSIQPGWLTVAQWLTLQGFSATRGERVLLGLELNKIARSRNIALPKPVPGKPCVYPVSLLSVLSSGKA